MVRFVGISTRSAGRFKRQTTLSIRILKLNALRKHLNFCAFYFRFYVKRSAFKRPRGIQIKKEVIQSNLFSQGLLWRRKDGKKVKPRTAAFFLYALLQSKCIRCYPLEPFLHGREITGFLFFGRSDRSGPTPELVDELEYPRRINKYMNRADGLCLAVWPRVYPQPF